MAPRLKVYRTAIGFHDAYVAAPSQKAALAAWGSATNLFQRGLAEQVDDPKLTMEPLAHPGMVVKRLRGTAAEQIAALPPESRNAPPKPARRRPAPAPPPSREALDAAERTLAEADRRHTDEKEALARREAALVAERRRIGQEQAEEIKRLEGERDRARAAYEAAVTAWRG